MAETDDGTSEGRLLPANDNVRRGASTLTDRLAPGPMRFIGPTTIPLIEPLAPANDNCAAPTRER